MADRDNWLDLKTQEQLAADPPEKLAPPTVDGYSLVLLTRGYDRDRVDSVVRSLAEDPSITTAACPCVLRRGLALTDAMEGQCELICVDSISVFIDDGVLLNAKPSYLRNLFVRLRSSNEFRLTRIRVTQVPANEEGERFLKQFFGEVRTPPIKQVVAYKKARIIERWAAKLGVIVESERAAR